MSDLRQYEIDDPTFVDDLKNSHGHVGQVARWLASLGVTGIRINPLRIRGNVEDMNDFSDDGDLTIQGYRVEVKQRMIHFTSHDDFPYRDRTIFVDACHCWDRAEPKPALYILTNKSVTHAMVVEGSTFPRWSRTNRYDYKKGRTRSFYECPIDLAAIVPMETAK